MTQATNTQLGEIQLAGDLAGNGGIQVGTSPQLKTMPGLVPGQYNIPRITVDSKGRVTAIQNGSVDITALLPNATADTSGVVKIGENINIAGTSLPGYWIANFNKTLTMDSLTGLSNQACASYGFDVIVNGGEIQHIRVFGNKCDTVAKLLAEINGMLFDAVADVYNGNFRIVSTLNGNTSRVIMSNVELFECMVGFVAYDGETVGFGACEIYVDRASIDAYGVVKIGNGIDVVDGEISVNITSYPTATTTTIGGVIVPPSGNLVIGVDGAVSVPIASDSTFGVVKIGAGLTSVDGVLDVSLPNATTSIKGVVQVGDNILVENGVISIPEASTTVAGVAKIGDGLSVVDGTISLNIATNTSIGAVKGGGVGIEISPDGTIVALEFDDATTTSKGLVQIGSGLNVTAGVISIPTATTTSKGLVQIGSGLNVTAGKVGVDLANGATKGIVASANSSRLSIVDGMIDVVEDSIALTDSVNIFTKAQISQAVILSGDSISLDLSSSNTFSWNAPNVPVVRISSIVSPIVGGIYTIIINTAAATQSIVFDLSSTFEFNFANGTRPVPSNNSTDILTCICVGNGTGPYQTRFLCTYTKGVS